MNKVDYNLIMQQELSKNKGKVLLHCCCGPCATAVTERLLPLCEVDLFWYNPNVMGIDEELKRKENLQTVASFYSLSIIDGGYDNEEYLSCIKGLESEREGGKRCDICFYLRLKKTAIWAKNNGYDYFCSTLTVSPHKNATLINEIGKRIESEVGIKWLYNDFKKKEGFKRSTVLSQQMGLYRQNYCGCVYGKQGEN